MNKFQPTEMVNDAKDELSKLAPPNSIVDVIVTEDPVGHYSTNIKVQTKSRTYFAKKEDDFLYRSFSRALRALKAQIGKKRFNHIHQTVSLKNTNY